MNKNVLHLNAVCAKLNHVKIDYEYFFLTTDAPNLRKIEIYASPLLSQQDLLFISGFYNLEKALITAVINDYEQLKKLEKLREFRYIFCEEEKSLEVVKNKCQRVYNQFLNEGMSEKMLKNYLMYQRMILQNKYQDFFHKLYVPRLERIRWENKISANDLERIKKELIAISKMPLRDRGNISREKKKSSLTDSIRGLDFDSILESEDEIVQEDSRLFDSAGIKYYQLNRRIL